MIEKRCQLAVAAEDAEGTAHDLDGTCVLLVMNPKFNPATEISDRANVSSSLSPWSAIPGARSATMEFDVELKGSGTAGTAPAFGKLLQACGFHEDTDASSVTYLPVDSAEASVTMAMYQDGIIQKIWGARGTVSLKLEKGKAGLFHFVFTGADYSVATGTMLSEDVSYEDTAPVPFIGATLSVLSYSALVGSLEINLANAVALRDDVTTSSGHLSAVITGRRPTLSMDPELVTVATHDFYGKLRSGLKGTLSLVLGADEGNIATITAPAVQYTAIKPGSKSGILSLGIDCLLSRSSGDDELSIVMT